MNITAPLLIYYIMATILSTMANNVDLWQPAGLPFLKLAVGRCLFPFDTLNLHMNQKGNGVKRMQSSISPSGK